MKKFVVCILMVAAMLLNITQAYAKEVEERDGKIFLENTGGAGITREEYNKLRANYSEKEIAKMGYSELMNLQDGNRKVVDKQTLYVKTDYTESETGEIKTKETIISPDKVEQELAKMNNRLFADDSAMSLQAVGSNPYKDSRQTAMKKMELMTYKNGSCYTVTMTNTWLSLPAVRSLDVIAIRFGAVKQITVLTASKDNTYAKQIWDGTPIMYQGSTSDKFNIDTKGTNYSKGKSGVGVTMNLKDDAKNSLICYLHVDYQSTETYAYSIYGAYEHATAAVSDTSYDFSPLGMGGVVEFKKNASVYDNTTGLSVLADRKGEGEAP